MKAVAQAMNYKAIAAGCVVVLRIARLAGSTALYGRRGRESLEKAHEIQYIVASTGGKGRITIQYALG
jgi:hypothetical protein